MSMATDAYAPWIGLAFLALAIAIRLAWRAKWRRDDRRARALAAGIADERRISLMEPDPTPYEDEPTEEIVLDPPVVPRYVAGGPVSAGTPFFREPDEVIAPITQEWVSFGPRWMHKTCLEARRDGRRPCAECAPHLVTGVTP